MATERVLIVLDLTKEEAWDVANKLASGPPRFVKSNKEHMDVPAMT